MVAWTCTVALDEAAWTGEAQDWMNITARIPAMNKFATLMALTPFGNPAVRSAFHLR